jgi:hypothetical protein
MERRAFEPTGLVPRSIIRTLNRFIQQLKPETEAIAVQEFRISRYQVLVSVRSLILIFFIPLFVNIGSKAFFFEPFAQYIWNTHQHEIFLNSYQENRAFLEMQDFSERIFFESLIKDEKSLNTYSFSLLSEQGEDGRTDEKIFSPPQASLVTSGERERMVKASGLSSFTSVFTRSEKGYLSGLGLDRKGSGKEEKIEENIEIQFQKEALELATYYNDQSITALSNIFGESFTLLTLSLLLVSMRPQIIILKSFLTESIYSLSDTTKSFLLILLTDLLVGFHSPRGWEIALETTLKHFGVPENQDFIFLFVATFPVFLDTVFKYWIFRYLNKISPSTVVTYHNMIE